MDRMESKTPFYKRYWHIRARCLFEWDKDYKRYGGSGIKFEWRDYDHFKEDMYELYLQHKAKYGDKNTTIDRIDPKGNYCKENCRWATTTVQARNKSTNRYYTHNGKTMIIADWARKIGCSRQALRYRLEHGLTIDQAISLPFKHNNKYDPTLSTSKKNNTGE
jgi:hypothetical protein